MVCYASYFVEKYTFMIRWSFQKTHYCFYHHAKVIPKLCINVTAKFEMDR